MPFTLQINFEGLIGFVPLSGGDDASSMVAMLVDAREARQASDGAHLHPHFPVVRFTKSDLKEGAPLTIPEDTFQILKFVSNTGSNPDGYWFLDRQELQIRYDGEKSPLQIWDEETVPSSNGLFAGKTSENFFSHVPRIEAFVDPSALVPQPKKGTIAARFRMTEGLIQATKLERNPEDNKLIEIDLRPLGSSESKTTKGRVVSSGVLWSVQVPSDSVTLYSTSFKSGIVTPVMTLAPGGAENVVRLKVKNVPLEDLLELPGMGHSKAAIDRHFEMFYELCAQRPPLRRTPIPHVRTNGAGAAPVAGGHAHGATAGTGTGPIRITDLSCPPATFLG